MLSPIPPPAASPPLRVPGFRLPRYRYVPGLHAHPFRHVDGHMYTDGSAPSEAPWDPNTPWEQDERYLWGADLFDHRYYWESHEVWEALWHSATPGAPVHRLLQSLIQFAAATLKMHTGHHGGARRLHARATKRFETIQDDVGPVYRGIQLETLSDRVAKFLDGGPWPTMPMVRP